MRITTLWHEGEDGDMPWMLSAYDEYTEEEHNGTPEFYQKIKDEFKGKCRELNITVPDEAVTRLFDVPTVKGRAT